MIAKPEGCETLSDAFSPVRFSSSLHLTSLTFCYFSSQLFLSLLMLASLQNCGYALSLALFQRGLVQLGVPRLRCPSPLRELQEGKVQVRHSAAQRTHFDCTWVFPVAPCSR